MIANYHNDLRMFYFLPALMKDLFIYFASKCVSPVSVSYR